MNEQLSQEMTDQSINETKVLILEEELRNTKGDLKDLKDKMNELRMGNNSFVYTALCKVQAEMPIVQHDASSFAKQSFASFAEIKRISAPILTKHGLAVTQIFHADNMILETRLLHVTGQFIESNIKISIAESAEKLDTMGRLKEVGKAISYIRRYSYSCIVGISTEESD